MGWSIGKTMKIIDEMEHDETKDGMVQTPSISHCAIPSTPGTTT